MNPNYKFYSNKNVTDIKPVDENFKFIENPFDLSNVARRQYEVTLTYSHLS